MRNTVRTHGTTVLFIGLLLAVMFWMVPATTGRELRASAQVTCYLPVVFQSWPPVPGPCSL
jgi:hypothetical protein